MIFTLLVVILHADIMKFRTFVFQTDDDQQIKDYMLNISTHSADILSYNKVLYNQLK